MEEGKKRKTHLEMAEELNDMDERDMTSAEADFHEKAIVALRVGKALGPKDGEKLEKLHGKYFPDPDAEDELRRPPVAGDEDEELEAEVDF